MREQSSGQTMCGLQTLAKETDKWVSYKDRAWVGALRLVCGDSGCIWSVAAASPKHDAGILSPGLTSLGWFDIPKS